MRSDPLRCTGRQVVRRCGGPGDIPRLHGSCPATRVGPAQFPGLGALVCQLYGRHSRCIPRAPPREGLDESVKCWTREACYCGGSGAEFGRKEPARLCAFKNLSSSRVADRNKWAWGLPPCGQRGIRPGSASRGRHAVGRIVNRPYFCGAAAEARARPGLGSSLRIAN